MANLTFAHGSVSVGTTATFVATVTAVIVQNAGETAVFLGGPNVTATGATQGICLAANATMTIPTVALLAHDLYAVVASDTGSLVYLSPQ